MCRIKNQPSNSTSCSDNALHLLVLVAGIFYWGLQVTSPFSILGCVLKACFERGRYILKGIEDFNLEHWAHRIGGWKMRTPMYKAVEEALYYTCLLLVGGSNPHLGCPGMEWSGVECNIGLMIWRSTWQCGPMQQSTAILIDCWRHPNLYYTIPPPNLPTPFYSPTSFYYPDQCPRREFLVGHAKRCYNEFGPPWIDIECSLFKPPHYFHACTKDLRNMEGFVSKTTNSLPKVMMS